MLLFALRWRIFSLIPLEGGGGGGVVGADGPDEAGFRSSRRRKATGRRRNPPDDWFQVEQYPFLQDAGGDQPGHRPGPIFQALRRCNLCLPKGQHPPNTHPTPTHWPVPTVPDPSPRPPAQHQRKSPGSTSPNIPDPNQAPGRSTLLRTPSIHCRDAMPDLDIKSCFPIWTCSLLQTPSHTHPTTHTPYHHARFLRYPHLADLPF